MSFLENLENYAFQEVDPRVLEIIEEMKNDPEFQDLMKRLSD
jgi:hypothetical protein